MKTPLNSDWVDHAAKALNEQGFLFQQKASEEMEAGFDTGRHKWILEATEYPVSAANGKQTRIDLVLSHHQHNGVHLAVECKRHNPSFKAWLVFDTSPLGRRHSERSCFLETARIQQRPLKGFQDVCVTIDSHEMEDHRAFNFYLECKLDWPTQGPSGQRQRASSTDAIEDALGQIMLGQSGLMKKLWRIKDHMFCRSIPVILTTAQLLEVQHAPQNVSVEQGLIEAKDLKLTPLDFAPINYRAADDLSLNSIAEVFSGPDITSDLISRQTRTVFVVQSKSIVKFLAWAGHHLVEHLP